jgi:methanogenic corrinoid protein MtbC1
MSQELVNAIAEIKEDDALTLAREMAASGADPLDILADARKAMDIVGKLFEDGEYFLPELIMAGDMLSQITDLVKPQLAKLPQVEAKGKVIIGSVAGDIHDIGKNIVTFMLGVNGFEVHDLGTDVSPAKFVSAIQELKPDVVGLSGFLTLAFNSMKDTVAAIKASGLRDQVKIMIGGGQVTDLIREYTAADAYGDDAMEAVALAQKWTGG